MLKFNSKTLFKVMFCTFIILFFVLINQVSANSINNIDMDVYIDNNGNATITEVWNANLTEGTEGYRPYTKLGNSTISNFSVKDQTGKIYQNLSSWNTSASFSSKAYKSGIHTISNGVELCWGISNYGNNTYTLKYDISKFVTQYTDAQGIYFNFLNLDQRVSKAKITIHSDYNFSLDNSKIWSFGYNGNINFIDGKIVLDSVNSLSSSQYMVALVRFDDKIFNTTSSSKKSFDNIYNSAMSTVSDNSYSKVYRIFPSMYLWADIIIFFVIIFPTLFHKKRYRHKKSNIEYYKPLNLGPKIKKKEISYFRDIPCDGDLFYAYWIMVKYNILKEDECKNNIVGALLLKWISEGYIELSKAKGGLFNFKDNKFAISFKNIDTDEFHHKAFMEKNLMMILKSASGKNNILEPNEFRKWCKYNNSEMNGWFDSLISQKSAILEEHNLILRNKITKKKLFRTKTIITKYVDNSVRVEALNLLGLKKYLLDYSLIPDRPYVNVHILEDYLIFAQLLGIADKVEKQFSKLYPDFKEFSNINIDNASFCAKSLSVDMISILATETLKYEKRLAREQRRRSRQYSSSDRDSGSGGDSYSSGGDSSGGSSGGGFR